MRRIALCAVGVATVVTLTASAFASEPADRPSEPDDLAELTARLCSLSAPAHALTGAYAATPSPDGRAVRRLTTLAAEVDRVCELYRTQGDGLVLGQE